MDMTLEEYTDFINSLMLQRMQDMEYLSHVLHSN
jgi:hypothetical protein